MTRHATRVVLVVLLAAALSGAALFLAREEVAAAPWRATAAHFALDAAQAQHALADVRTGQLALAAPGQANDWWEHALASSVARASTSLEQLQQTSTDPAAREQLALAAGALETLREVGTRAAELTGAAKPAQAATLVLTEGLGAAATAAHHIEIARQAEAQALDDRLAAVRERQAYAAAGAGVFAILVGLLLVPRGTTRRALPVEALAPVSEAAAPARLVAAGPTTASLASEPAAEVRIASASSIAGPVALQPAAMEAPVAQPPLAHAPDTAAVADSMEAWPARDRRKAPELRAAADLCTDFARLLDGQELPALLERAARLLDAAGLIVWVADQSQQELRPLLAHGYTAQALARLPAIPRGADNATAAAFRESKVEVVKTNGMSPGAVAVPLLAAQGCIGVMAAEVRHGREASESARALARIVAAQLATLVSVVPADEATQPLPKQAAQ